MEHIDEKTLHTDPSSDPGNHRMRHDGHMQFGQRCIYDPDLTPAFHCGGIDPGRNWVQREQPFVQPHSDLYLS